MEEKNHFSRASVIGEKWEEKEEDASQPTTCQEESMRKMTLMRKILTITVEQS